MIDTHIDTWITAVANALVRGGIALLAAWAFSIIPTIPAVVKCWTWRAAYLVLIVSFFWTRPVDVPIDLTSRPPAIDEVVMPEHVTIPHTVKSSLIVETPVSPVRSSWPAIAFECWLGFSASLPCT